jgi:MoxR-like ATPase
MEQEGTYPLPEAQLDRFMLQIGLTFPDAAAERAMLLATTGAQNQTGPAGHGRAKPDAGAGTGPAHAGG